MHQPSTLDGLYTLVTADKLARYIHQTPLAELLTEDCLTAEEEWERKLAYVQYKAVFAAMVRNGGRVH